MTTLYFEILLLLLLLFSLDNESQMKVANKHNFLKFCLTILVDDGEVTIKIILNHVRINIGYFNSRE